MIKLDSYNSSYKVTFLYFFLFILTKFGATSQDGSFTRQTIKDKGGGSEKYHQLSFSPPSSSSSSSSSSSPTTIHTFKHNGHKHINRNSTRKPESDLNESSNPIFVTSDWGECTGICGTGTRERRVDCKILMDFSKIMLKLPDYECIGEKPSTVEECQLDRPCPVSDYGKSAISEALVASISSTSSPSPSLEMVDTYSWKTLGFTECSAPCLGGTQEEIVECVRDNDDMVVSHHLCNIEDKPDSITKTCNDHPCPPRWNISDFGPCSKPCGIGIQTRQVNCIHEVTRGSENTLIVADDKCVDPKPVEERVCNEADCPIEKPVKWANSKCKGKNCLPEVKPKQKKCKKDYRGGSNTPTTGKCIKKHCKSGKCKQRSEPTADENNTVDRLFAGTFIQTSEKKVTLKVGGTAVIYEGTTLKIRCPQRKDSNGLLPEIIWTKDGFPLDFSDDRVSITRLGALKIHNIKHSDSGNFTCSHGSTKLSMTVLVPLPYRSDSKDPFLDVTSAKDEFSNVEVGANLHGKIKPEPPYEVIQATEKSSLQKLSAYFTSLKNNNNNNNNNDQTKGQDENKIDFDGGMTDSRSVYFADQQSGKVKNSPTSDFEDLENVLKRARKASFDFNPEFVSSSPQHLNWPAKQSLTSAFESQYKDIHSSDNSSSSNLLKNYAKIRPDFHSKAHESLKQVGGKFEWFVSPWSNCSLPCGGLGIQVRATKCLMVKSLHSHKETSDENCIKTGLEKPESVKPCFLACPEWKVGEWGKCSKCVEFGVGKQSRSVSCTRYDQSLPDSECDQSQYPTTSQTCSNADCRPMWSSEDWKMCSGVCDKEGSQTRFVKCVWLADQTSEANGCDELNKPITVRKCQVNCIDKQSDCQNKSFLCQYGHPDSCEHPNFQNFCCKSCRHLDFIGNRLTSNNKTNST